MKQAYSNLTVVSKEATNDFFENFFQGTGSITEEQFDAVIAYFENRADNKQTAYSLAVALLSGAYNQNITPMELLDQFRKVDARQFDLAVAFFLNLTRVPTSAVGVSNAPKTGKYVARSILP